MKNYRLLSGCHNCGNIFVRREYDEHREYYCSAGAPPRPACMSVCMGECPGLNETSDVEYILPGHCVTWEEWNAENDKALHKWEEWKKDRSVEQFGICDIHVCAEGEEAIVNRNSAI